MTHWTVLGGASVLAALLGARAGAANPESLEQAWALALQRDHTVAVVRNQAEAADLEAQAARGERWPSVTLSGAYAKLDDSPAFDFSFTGLPLSPPELFEDDSLVSGAATVAVPLYTGGRISSSIAASAARARGTEAQAAATVADVRLAVADAFVGVLRARKALAVATSSVRTLEAVARDTTSLYERELVPKNELLTAQVALADAKQQELRAAHAAEVALAVYNRRLGAPLDRAVELDEALAASPPDLPQALEALVEQALARRTELTALQAQSEAYGHLARGERSRVLPQLMLSGRYQYLQNRFLDDETVGMAGIGVQWALFDGGQSRKRAAALERTRHATDQQRADAESLIALQVREAWLGRQEARQRVAVTAQAAAQADESLRIAQERYAAGLGTQTQLLEAETLRVTALRNRDDARLDAQLTELRLARAAGRL